MIYEINYIPTKANSYFIEPDRIVDLKFTTSINTPFIDFSLTLIDNTASEIFDFIKGDKVNIKIKGFKTNGEQTNYNTLVELVELDLFVYKISRYSSALNEQDKFILHLISEPIFNAYTKYNSKTYENKSATDIIKDQLNMINLETNDFDEPTTKFEILTFPLWTTFHNLTYITDRMTDGKSGYLFWQDIETLNLNIKSIHNLFKGNFEDYVNSKTYQNGELIEDGIGLVENQGGFNIATELSITKDTDIIKMLNNGIGKTNVINFNLNENEIYSTDETITDNLSSTEHLGDYSIYTKDIIGTNEINIFNYNLNESSDDLLKIKYSRQLLNGIEARAELSGDIFRKVGMKIKVNFRQKLPRLTDEKSDYLEKYTGYYIISDIQHYMTISEYNQVVILKSDSFYNDDRDNFIKW